MPVLSNQRHELFAQALAAGKTQAEAYASAGYQPSEPNASRLTRNEKVQARVAELQERAAKRTEITVASLTDMLLADRDGARSAEQFAAAISAVEKIGKLHGLVVDRKEIRTGRLDELTDAEIAALIREENPGLAAGVDAPPGSAGKPH